jgi:prepilin-type N-terminal cleavage/methylation domain-containing protein
MRHAFENSGLTRSSDRRRRGFTLIEAAMVTVIIGVGVVSMLQLLAAGTVSNSEGTELTTAINLANNIREMSLGLAYYDPNTDMTITPPPYQWNTKEATVKAYDNIMDLDGATDTWNQTSDPETGVPEVLPAPGRSPRQDRRVQGLGAVGEGRDRFGELGRERAAA